MASKNAQDGVSLVQTAESALQTAHDLIQRGRELSVQAANDTNQTEDRDAIQKELNQIIKELDRISATTEFNKKTLLDGSLSSGKTTVITTRTETIEKTQAVSFQAVGTAGGLAADGATKDMDKAIGSVTLTNDRTDLFWSDLVSSGGSFGTVTVNYDKAINDIMLSFR